MSYPDTLSKVSLTCLSLCEDILEACEGLRDVNEKFSDSVSVAVLDIKKMAEANLCMPHNIITLNRILSSVRRLYEKQE